MLKMLSPLCDVHFILGQHVLEDDAYAKFYAEQGGLKIMDNGLHERDVPLTTAELREAALLCNPTVVVAPDFRKDASATYEAYVEARERWKHDPWKVACAIQGKDETSRLELFMGVRSTAHMICFPYKENRFEWFQQLLVRIPKHVKWPPLVHLFGVSTFQELYDFNEVFAELKMSDRVSVDTGKPIKWGLQNKEFKDGMNMQGAGLMDLKTKAPSAEQLCNVLFNIAYLRKFL